MKWYWQRRWYVLGVAIVWAIILYLAAIGIGKNFDNLLLVFYGFVIGWISLLISLKVYKAW